MSDWTNDKIQFARLLSELNAAGIDDETLMAVGDSMDIGDLFLNQLFTRAERHWKYSQENRVMEHPMTVAKAKYIADDNNFISGVIKVELSSIIGCDLEGVLNMFGSMLVEDGELLSGTSYNVVGHEDNMLLIEVSGNIEIILDSQPE